MSQLIWDLFIELRKEVLQAQKIRAQVLGFKFTFISTSMGLLANYKNNIDATLFVVPAFAAVFFDFIVCSYSFSVKRIGCYVREYIEPALQEAFVFPQDFVLWEQFLTQPATKQKLSLYGNLGSTLLTLIIAIIALSASFSSRLTQFLCFTLIVFFLLDIAAYFLPSYKLSKLSNKSK